MLENLKKFVKDYQMIIVMVVAIAFISYDRQSRQGTDSSPKPEPTKPEVSVQDEYQKMVNSTFVGEFVLDDCAYLSGVFEGMAAFIEEDSASSTTRIKSSAEFSVYWTDMGAKMKKGVKGKYKGFDSLVSLLITRIDSDELKQGEPYNKSHKEKIANEIRTVSKALMTRAAKS